MKPAAPRPEPQRGHAEPCLLAYDVADRRRLQRVGRVMARWRIGGQKSVHECLLTGREQVDLLAEVDACVDKHADRLLLARLPWGRGGPAVGGVPSWRLMREEHCDWRLSAELPLADTVAWTLLAYDVRDPRRLARVHRLLAAVALPLQRSLFLYLGNGSALSKELALIETAVAAEDDVRIYRLGHPRRLWWLCGGVPLVDAEAGVPAIAAETLIWY